jgi:hypothetical protein
MLNMEKNAILVLSLQNTLYTLFKSNQPYLSALINLNLLLA